MPPIRDPIGGQPMVKYVSSILGRMRPEAVDYRVAIRRWGVPVFSHQAFSGGKEVLPFTVGKNSFLAVDVRHARDKWNQRSILSNVERKRTVRAWHEHRPCLCLLTLERDSFVLVQTHDVAEVCRDHRRTPGTLPLSPGQWKVSPGPSLGPKLSKKKRGKKGAQSWATQCVYEARRCTSFSF